MVVLETIRPSMPRGQHHSAISSSAASSRSGAILSSSGIVPAFAGARSRQRAQQARQLVLVLQAAQARRVGRGDIDRHIIGQRRQRREGAGIIGDAVGAVLVGADIDADDAARLRRAQIARRRLPCRHC